jgi:hypothetical protein
MDRKKERKKNLKVQKNTERGKQKYRVRNQRIE